VPERKLITLRSEYKQAFDMLLPLTQRELRIFDPDLSELGLHTEAFSRELRDFLARSRGSRLYIALHDVSFVSQRAPRFVDQTQLPIPNRVANGRYRYLLEDKDGTRVNGTTVFTTREGRVLQETNRNPKSLARRSTRLLQDLEGILRHMDDCGIDVAMIQMPNWSIAGMEVCRVLNDGLAAAARQNPGRFLPLAVEASVNQRSIG